MKKYLFLLIAVAFFSLPAHSDSFYIMGSYFTPDGDSDIFDQNKAELTFKVDDLNDFGGTFGYNLFHRQLCGCWRGLQHITGRQKLSMTAILSSLTAVLF